MGYAPNEQKFTAIMYVTGMHTMSRRPVPVLAHKSRTVGNEKVLVSGQPEEDEMEKMEHWLKLLMTGTHRNLSDEARYKLRNLTYSSSASSPQYPWPSIMI
jgi:hypothetical protein